MWKELSNDPDGMVFWSCMLGGLVLVVVNLVFNQ